MNAPRPEPIHTDKAPAAIGPYSQAIRHGGLLYCSGQIGLDPVSMKLVGQDIESQTRQSLTNLAAVLEAGGSGMGQVLQTTVYLQNMTDFPAMNAIYQELFGDWKPARATVAAAGLPLGARFEIACVAVVG